MEEYGYFLDEELFCILMCEVEVIINFKFLIIVFGDFDDLELLSFNYILMIKFFVVLLLFGKF